MGVSDLDPRMIYPLILNTGHLRYVPNIACWLKLDPLQKKKKKKKKKKKTYIDIQKTQKKQTHTHTQKTTTTKKTGRYLKLRFIIGLEICTLPSISRSSPTSEKEIKSIL